ncbi:Uu.00g027090.m01.CDS01 [Anthostomella pinea]|uniref:Uu.00g027090.m01.CDS01 n=1 Tax=Anthostomella pinea TaxID=933095 RepID=A0AAI8V8P0_9PEZI|nr:Uu.00g027090.m01.CDS01 [Anthostomella pinea]
MAPPSACLADDWEEVDNDDSFSVVSLPSLPSSRAGSPVPWLTAGMQGLPSSQAGSPAPSLTADSIIPRPVRLNFFNNCTREPSVSFPYETSDEEPEVEPSVSFSFEIETSDEEPEVEVEHYGMDTKDVIHTEPKEPKEPQKDSMAEETQLSDMLDVDIDPTFLYNVTTSLVKLISEIVASTRFRGNYQPLEDTDKINKACEELKSHLKDMEPILQGYAKHWKPEGEITKLPIDPGLYEWMASLRIELLGLQAVLQTEMQGRASSSTQTWGASDAKHYHDTLFDFCGQIEAFMPTIGADFNEFHTASLPCLTTCDVPDTFDACTPMEGRNGCGSSRERTKDHTNRPPSSHLVFHLRRAVYALKDQVSACIDELQASKEHGLANTKEELIELADVTKSYYALKSNLDLVLSNHSSDWIDHSLSGGLTYLEFSRLNPDTIRSVTLQLKTLEDNLFLERRRVESMRYVNDPDGLLEDAKLTVKKCDMEGLSTAQEVISSLFRCSNSPPSPQRLLASLYGQSSPGVPIKK